MKTGGIRAAPAARRLYVLLIPPKFNHACFFMARYRLYSAKDFVTGVPKGDAAGLDGRATDRSAIGRGTAEAAPGIANRSGAIGRTGAGEFRPGPDRPAQLAPAAAAAKRGGAGRRGDGRVGRCACPAVPQRLAGCPDLFLFRRRREAWGG